MKKLFFIIINLLVLNLSAQVSWNGNNVNQTPNISSALGTNHTSTGFQSFAIGDRNTSTGPQSFVGGFRSTSTGIQSLSFGHWCTSSGHSSIALGARSVATNDHSMALGIDIRSTGNRAHVIGAGVGNSLAQTIVNNIPNSLMVGYRSNIPTFFVSSSSGVGTYGSVGIGTINPESTLQVNGDVRIRNNDRVLFGIGGSGNGEWIRNNINAGGGGGFGLSFGVNFTESMRLFANTGHLGINTAVATHRLHVVGANNQIDPVRFETLQYAKDRDVVTVDNQGVLHRRFFNFEQTPSLNCSTLNNVPRITSTNVLGCSQIFDSGNTVGIGINGNLSYNTAVDSGIIGNPIPTSGIVRLNINGASRSLAHFVYSDLNKKENVSDISDPMSKIMKMNGKSYSWNEKTQKEHLTDNSTHYGFIAQELSKVLPGAVMIDNDKNYSVNYSEIIPILVEAIKSQQDEINNLKKILNIKKENKTVNDTSKEKKTKAIIYPNPSSDIFNVTFPESFTGQVQVSDMLGKVIFTKEVKDKSNDNIDLSNQEKGVYIVKFQNENTSFSEKLIKN